MFVSEYFGLGDKLDKKEIYVTKILFPYEIL